jgi:hypothetical protein
MVRRPTYSLDDHSAEKSRILATMTRNAIRAEAKSLGASCYRCKTKSDYASTLATFRLQTRDGKIGEWVSQ